MSMYTVHVTVGSTGVHVNVTPKPPVGTLIKYKVTAVGGTLRNYLDSGGGTQNYVYVGIASGAGGTPASYAPTSTASSLTLVHEATSWSKASDGTYESGDALFVSSKGAKLSATATLYTPS